ncbi:hypothetical protein [Bradyrhizobium sp. SZCCHNRI1029]|uniref:hypothetical protein n=1 Tax=Bradyrhizobium sp. SZCCHNRI1029 TaxID=3057278 RepID=UPI0029163853|nr:hypothetical protein [Bradyrhizobium sp. SZCCHNRI1029]
MAKKPTTTAAERFSPSEWMRRRRPELFSDSSQIEEPQLSSEVFGYHLNTLTSRREEVLFENFARRLCEKEVCPNLVPQTGPTGGGDGKVDTETYPIAESLADTWFEGFGTEAANERWAFAFSAKKDWLPKVRSDVAKAAATGRGYSRIFFVTNQFVPDKKRSDAQDELSKQYVCNVTIFDRTWITAKVFENRREQLAIDMLGLTNVQSRKLALGPLDLERNKELEDLEAEIGDPSRYNGIAYHRVEDCLVAACLARGLEKTRIDVEGRFARARQLADKVGDRRQKLRVVYEHAWTEFWWYDDFNQLSTLFDTAEELASGSDEIDDIELLQNLWTVLFNTVSNGALTKAAAKLDARTVLLKAELERLASDQVRITSATRAKTQLLLTDLIEARADRGKAETVLTTLCDLLDTAKSLGSYPFDYLVKIFREIGPAFAESDAYDRIFEKLLSIFEERQSGIEGGRLLLTRGFQKHRAERYQDALRLFGRAQEKLLTHESRRDLIIALFGAGLSYEKLGLLWAAWSSFVGAAVTALAEFKERSAVTRPALLAIQRLEWLDLCLGRVPYILAWRQLGDLLATHLRLRDEDLKEFQEERMIQDATLGILILKSDLNALKRLAQLPASFETLELPLSDVALDYATGNTDKMKKEGLIPEGETADETERYFLSWINQPVAKDIPEKLILMDEAGFRFEGVVLGCKLVAVGKSEPTAIHLAESLFAAVEAFLATSLEEVQPYQEEVNLSLEPDAAAQVPTTTIDRNRGVLTVRIAYPTNYAPSSPTEREQFRSWLISATAEIMGISMIHKDASTHIEKLARDERVFSRVLLFAETAIGVENVLGSNAMVRFRDWIVDGNKKALGVLRKTPWLEPKPTAKEIEQAQSFGEGPPPPELADLETFSHRDRRVSSIIDINLWNKARWRGTAFFHYGPPYPPLLGIMYTDKEAGRQIFEAWRKRFGSFDEDDQIRIAILTGVDKSNPYAYRVIVGTQPDLDDPTKLLVMTSRFHTMKATTSANLDLFIEQHKLAKSYGLVPAFPDSQGRPVPATDLVIGKTQVVVRPAWQVGDNDPDIVTLRPDDDVIIPADEKDVPFLRALERMRRR